MSVANGRLAVAERAIAVLKGRQNGSRTLALDEVNSPTFEGTLPERRRVVLLDDTEIAELGTPAQLIDGILPANGLVLVIGEKGTLKTFLALDWAAHIQLGLPDWHGCAVQRGQTIYVWGEGRTGILPRTEGWKKYHGTGDLGILFVPHRITVNEPSSVRDLIDAIAERHGGSLDPIALIVIDTLNRNFAGNENSAEDMSAFVRGCDTLREEFGATVVVVHHKGHGEADRGRGSSVLDAAADTIVFCTRDADRLTLKCLKQKDGAEFAPLAMEAMSVAPSLVLRPTGLASGLLTGNRLAALRVLVEQSTDKGWTGRTWWDASGIKSKSSFYDAISWLRANSYVSPRGECWLPTDAGRLAVRSVKSNESGGSPTVQSGLRQQVVQSQGGI